MSRVKEELRQLAILAGPLIAGFLGNQLLGIVDTAMVGRLGDVDLAGVAVGSGGFFAIIVLGLGLVLGADPLLAQAIGAKEGARAEVVKRRSIAISLWVAAPLTAVIAIFPWLLPRFGVDQATARAASSYLWGRLPSVAPFLLFNAYRGYLQSREVTTPIVIASVVGNLINLFFNVVLIFGDRALTAIGLPAIGLPSLGVLGSGIASSIAQVAMLWVVMRAANKLQVLPGEGDLSVSYRAVLRVGVPIGLTLVAEVGAFALVGVLAARLGPDAAAGHQIALILASTTFIVSLAIGSATTVRVGQAIGQKDRAAARLTGMVSFAASLVFMSLSATMFLLFAPTFAGLLSNRIEVLRTAIPLIHIAAVFQIFDGAQAVGAGALRGVGDTRFIQLANMIGHYAIGLPIAVVLAFVLGQRESGLWWGLSAGLIVVAVMLFGRFWVLSNRSIARLS